MIIALGGADRSVAAVCLAAIGYAIGQQLAQVAATYRLAGIDPKARARLNGCIIFAVFVGQVRCWRILQLTRRLPGRRSLVIYTLNTAGRPQQRHSSPSSALR